MKSQKQLFLQGCNTGQRESLALHIPGNPQQVDWPFNGIIWKLLTRSLKIFKHRAEIVYLPASWLVVSAFCHDVKVLDMFFIPGWGGGMEFYRKF